MSTYFIEEDSVEESKSSLRRCLDIGLEFKIREKIHDSADFEWLYSKLSEPLPETGVSLPNLLNFVEDNIIPFSTNYSSPYAMAFPDAGNSTAALSGAILSDFLNQNLINWNPCSPVGTIIEMIVLNWLRKLVGYSLIDKPQTPDQVGGVVVTGGVSSNTIAMLIARER